MMELVFGEGLRREDIDSAVCRIFKDCLQDGQVVTEGFATGGGCHHGNVVALANELEASGLVTVELADACFCQSLLQVCMQEIGQGCPPGLRGRLVVDGANG